MCKRSFDLFFSILGICVLAPLFLLIAIAIKADSRGPVFFRQQRVGRRGSLFPIYKFRTMIDRAPIAGPQITAGGDPRITRVGRILRKSKLDELPQLFNVLAGQMSFVGPRPEVPKYVDLFKEDFRQILEVRPGITDYAAVEYSDEETVLKGFENPEEGYVRVVLPAKIALYRKYLGQQSLMNDIRIILATLRKISGT
ncbi:MAG: sugar transferase [Nitrospiraceae bacterium]|nr:sugar transferase [Nitrospiraceae bacterium]